VRRKVGNKEEDKNQQQQHKSVDKSVLMSSLRFSFNSSRVNYPNWKGYALIKKLLCERAPNNSFSKAESSDGKEIKIKGKKREKKEAAVKKFSQIKIMTRSQNSFSVFMDKWFVTLSNKVRIALYKKRGTEEEVNQRKDLSVNLF
jgi:hypothetical protein